MKKTAVLIIGGYDSGKTSIIRALTGITGRNYLWQVSTVRGRRIWAFVVISAFRSIGFHCKVPAGTHGNQGGQV